MREKWEVEAVQGAVKEETEMGGRCTASDHTGYISTPLKTQNQIVGEGKSALDGNGNSNLEFCGI